MTSAPAPAPAAAKRELPNTREIRLGWKIWFGFLWVSKQS